MADLVLKDKIVVYDLAGQRIGWADYDCKFSHSIKEKLKYHKTNALPRFFILFFFILTYIFFYELSYIQVHRQLMFQQILALVHSPSTWGLETLVAHIGKSLPS